MTRTKTWTFAIVWSCSVCVFLQPNMTAQEIAAPSDYPQNSQSEQIEFYKFYKGVDQNSKKHRDCEPRWNNGHCIPWEAFAYGEYIGPHRTPHVPQYRVRVNDELEFVYQIMREQTVEPYRLNVGDVIEVISSTDEKLNQENITILIDGSVSLNLIGQVNAAGKTIKEFQSELNDRYAKFFQTDPSIIVRGTKTETPLLDLRDAVDARSGFGGQSRVATVAPDGTVQLPQIGSTPVVGLTLDEISREINMRYREHIKGFLITPVLVTRAPRAIYVLGEVTQPGRFELAAPTSAMQSIALAGGWAPGGNLREIVVFRRDRDWRLMATRLDLSGALHARQPLPSDDIWLRDGDIVVVPKMPIQRLADMVDLYFTRTLYGVVPLVDGQSTLIKF